MTKYIIKLKNNIFKNLQGTHPDGGAHAKFTNYSFDVKEFLRIVSLARNHVKHHKAFNKFINNFHSEIQNDTKTMDNKESIQSTNAKESIRLQEKSNILSKDEL